MIEYHTNKGIIKILHTLYAEDLKTLDFYKFISYSYMRRDINNPLFIKKHRYTLLIDLTQDTDTIFEKYKTKTRNEIRRAIKEDVGFNIETNLIYFISFYNDFAIRKGQELLSYNSLKMLKPLTITKASQNNKAIVMHAYITDLKTKTVRLIYSASNRLDTDSDRRLTGWANRFLHHQDMLYFKEKNIKTYDLGGTAHHTKTKDNHHIEEFKKEFGGYIVDEYQYESIPHFLAINIKRLISQF